MEFGIAYTIGRDPQRSLAEAFGDAVEEIQLAEELGYTTVMLSSQHFEENDILPSPLVACAMIAARTKRIRIGPGILLFPLAYHPIHVAEDVAVLDVLSGGRLVFGTGQGFRKAEFAGFRVDRAERAARVREGVTIIRKLWTEDEVTYHGRYWQLDGVSLHPKPLQRPSPPIWIAAEWASAVKIAGEVGDGWFADPKQPLALIKKNYQVFRDAVAQSGRDPDKAHFAIWRELYVGETDAKAWDEAGDAMRSEFSKYLSWEHLVDDEGKIIPPDRTDLIDTLVRDRFVVGGPERCIEALTEYREMGITHFIAHFQFTGLPKELVKKSMRLLAEKVVPYV